MHGGKWIIDSEEMQQQAGTLADDLARNPSQQLTMEHVRTVVQAHSCRPKHRRYVDPPEVKDMIRRRKLLRGQERIQLSIEIQELRKLKQREWTQQTVRRAAAGEPAALLALRKRQAAQFAHHACAQRAEGQAQAVSDLKAFYQVKYSSERGARSSLRRLCCMPMSRTHDPSAPYNFRSCRK